MKRLIVYFFILLAIVILLTQASQAQPDGNKLGINVGWPYVGVKYNLSDLFAAEIRYANGEGIDFYAGRMYLTVLHTTPNLFVGCEGGSISFNSNDMQGTGYEAALFIGTEYFILKRFSISLDISPMFIGVSSGSTSVSGFEFTVNSSLCYYLF
jgi:hypothetical protein